MSGKQGHNHSVDTKSLQRSIWCCSRRCLFNKTSGPGILKMNAGEPRKAAAGTELKSRSSGRCENWLLPLHLKQGQTNQQTKHERGNNVAHHCLKHIVGETSLKRFFPGQNFVYTRVAMSMNNRHLREKQIWKIMDWRWLARTLTCFSQILQTSVCIRACQLLVTKPRHTSLTTNILKFTLYNHEPRFFLCAQNKHTHQWLCLLAWSPSFTFGSH